MIQIFDCVFILKVVRVIMVSKSAPNRVKTQLGKKEHVCLHGSVSGPRVRGWGPVPMDFFLECVADSKSWLTVR